MRTRHWMSPSGRILDKLKLPRIDSLKFRSFCSFSIFHYKSRYYAHDNADTPILVVPAHRNIGRNLRRICLRNKKRMRERKREAIMSVNGNAGCRKHGARTRNYRAVFFFFFFFSAVRHEKDDRVNERESETARVHTCPLGRCKRA